MSGENLTRDEAAARSRLIQVESYLIDIDLREVAVSPRFTTTTEVTFQASPGASSFIDIIAERVRQVSLNGSSLDPDTVFSDSRIALVNLSEWNTLVVVSEHSYTNSGEGLHRFIDPVDGEVYLYTQFEVPDSRRVFPVFEQPDLKASFQFTIQAPATWQIVSNQPSPSPEVEGASATWSFSPSPRISSYITALIAGPYTVVRDELTSSSGATIPLGLYARASLSEFLDADYIFDITKKGFAYFEKRFGVPYPFEKYDQLFVPEFNAGAMENAGAVTFTETYVFRSQVSDAIRERRVVTILHELAHMWFGDLVTMTWWNDLWLNESFAEWASTIATAEATEWTHAWTTFHAMEKSWAYKQDQLPSTHPIVANIRDIEDVQVNFDGITYAKGGSVLKQLVAWVGEEAFFSGVHNYFVKHQWGNATLADLLTELEATSGRELGGWSSVWLETAGVNTMIPRIEVDDQGVITQADLIQSAPVEWPTLRPHRLAVGLYNADKDGVTRRHQRIELDADGAETSITALVGLPRPDLILINDDDLAYTKIRLDPQSHAFAIKNLSAIEDPLARALVWGSTWDATRDAEIPPQNFIDLVLQHIGAETESTTVRTALGQLALVVRNYVTPSRRATALAQAGSAIWSLAESAVAGSDIQFQLVKAFCGLASTPEHLELLRALRAGKTTLPGLAIDTDLEWELLAGLALCGGATPSDIAEALSTDNTSNGQQAAARAESLLPGAASKRAIFDRLTGDATIPNAIVRSLTLGYDLVNNQRDLEGLVEPYFAILEEIWEERTYKIAEYIVEGLYPSSLVSESLVAASEQWLATHPSIPALRRIVEENLAGVKRALRVQASDSAATPA
ncbi:MAG: aminopeptidase N [actinobacterium acMicro-4]|nr:MAG: aminopeptidase N [actinobacterium acMicro-4]